MIPKDLLKKIRFIEITTSRLVNTVFAGEYHSVFKGRGMEFDEVREYDPQDDIRDIDWNVTARMGHPYTKKFVEERELTVIFVVDASSSGQYGTRGMTKSELIAELCALLAFSAVKNHDRVGLIIFSDQVEKFIPPKKGRLHVLRVIREILIFKPKHRATDINVALKTLSNAVKKRSTVFLFSDFISKDYAKLLKIAFKKHDIVAVVVEDPSEKDFPVLSGSIELRDAESGETFTLKSDRGFKERFKSQWQKRTIDREKIFSSIGLDHIEIETGVPYINSLVRFFKTRARRFR
ncbi:MAG: DUF58 domain-containing protein [Candidatus Omnitrophica bacterium CG07_land_8_20_14_0_80_50_8]|nr:MAG: DUF58 domain-containing protein [Candidatus Omnitrophica bacterium CG07_land_8_20_14_0_80_50_8]